MAPKSPPIASPQKYAEILVVNMEGTLGHDQFSFATPPKKSKKVRKKAENKGTPLAKARLNQVNGGQMGF